MPEDKKKYSLWIVPKGQAGDTLQELINKLATEYKAKSFVPHMTLVADIYANDNELSEVKQKINALTKQFKPFEVTLSEFGYLDEEFRCLYLLALSAKLDSVYDAAATQFPQVKQEHFKQMPHLSLLYGNYPEEVKKQIIDDNPMSALTFTVDSTDLYFTGDPTSSWREKIVTPFGS